MRFRIKSSLGLVVVLAVTVVTFISIKYFTSPSRTASRAIVKVVTVRQSAMHFTVRAVGTIESLQIAKISSQVAGFVQAIYFQDGKQVQENDLLIQLNNDEASAEVQAAEAALKLSQSTYQREAYLVKKNFGSAAQLDLLAADLKAKQAALAIANSTLAKKAIRAPFAGILTDKKISVGDYVDAGQLLVELVDNHRLVVSYHLPVKQLNYLQLGQAVKILGDSLPEKPIEAKVSYISPVIDADTRTVHVQATLEGQQPLLRPGMFVTVAEEVAAQNAMLIPEQALLGSAEGYYVYVVSNNQIEKQMVVLGKHLFGQVQVMSGVTSGQQIVTAGQDGVEEGMPVTVITTNTKEQ